MREKLITNSIIYQLSVQQLTVSKSDCNFKRILISCFMLCWECCPNQILLAQVWAQGNSTPLEFQLRHKTCLIVSTMWNLLNRQSHYQNITTERRKMGKVFKIKKKKKSKEKLNSHKGSIIPNFETIFLEWSS